MYRFNPSNPPAVAMNDESLDYLKEIVTNHHPKLMIVTDDVYGTFCDGFKSLMVTMPYHTFRGLFLLQIFWSDWMAFRCHCFSQR